MEDYENSKPNYYAVIPAIVRYDNDVMDKAKILYGELSALSNKKGYCFATNKYFADLYSISDRQVRTLLKSLADKGYIIVDNESQPRKIYTFESILEQKLLSTPPEENFHPPRKKTSAIIIQVIIIKKITLRHRSWCLSSKRGIQNIRIHEMSNRP